MDVLSCGAFFAALSDGDLEAMRPIELDGSFVRSVHEYMDTAYARHSNDRMKTEGR